MRPRYPLRDEFSGRGAGAGDFLARPRRDPRRRQQARLFNFPSHNRLSVAPLGFIPAKARPGCLFLVLPHLPRRAFGCQNAVANRAQSVNQPSEEEVDPRSHSCSRVHFEQVEELDGVAPVRPNLAPCTAVGELAARPHRDVKSGQVRLPGFRDHQLLAQAPGRSMRSFCFVFPPVVSSNCFSTPAIVTSRSAGVLSEGEIELGHLEYTALRCLSS